MDEDALIETFRRCFDYPDPSDLAAKRMEQIENRVTADQWSSKNVLDDFEALYSDLPEGQRSLIKDARRALIELRGLERNQRKAIRQTLDTSLSDSLDPVSVSVNEVRINSPHLPNQAV